MSILIPGMSLPKDGKQTFIVSSNGVVFSGSGFFEAIELPPHGDLIDREKIPFVESENGCQDDYAFLYDINEMTPVIPAEEDV